MLLSERAYHFLRLLSTVLSLILTVNHTQWETRTRYGLRYSYMALHGLCAAGKGYVACASDLRFIHCWHLDPCLDPLCVARCLQTPSLPQDNVQCVAGCEFTEAGISVWEEE